MRPPLKRTILTSEETGRRYFIARTAHRPNGRRHYVCSNPNCEVRLTRDSDRYCPAHRPNHVEEHESVANESKEMDEEDEKSRLSPTKMEMDRTASPIGEESISHEEAKPMREPASVEALNDVHIESSDEDEDDDDDDDDEMDREDGQIDNDTFDGSNFAHISDPSSSTPSLFVSKRSKRCRDIEVDQSTGTRSFRDESGRRRFVCSQVPCTKLLKRQGDVFCRKHATFNGQNGNPSNDQEMPERHSAPPVTKQETTEPVQPLTMLNNTLPIPDRPHPTSSNPYYSPKKPVRTGGTHRSFRDASGRIRFLCSNAECHRRVPRQAILYCRYHDPQSPDYNSRIPVPPKRIRTTLPKDRLSVGNMDVNHNNTNEIGESPDKKRRVENLSYHGIILPSTPVCIATTPLTDNQWSDVLQFFRQFPHVQLSPNLNVNNSTTHLLIDDSKNPLHCTITKKVVQGAVRRHIFILSTQWIRDSLQAGRCVDEHPYEIKSDTHTTLRLSEQDLRAKPKYLFDQSEPKKVYGFAIECRQCQGSISRNELIELIELAGGKLVENHPTVDILVVLCDINDKTIDRIKEKYDQYPAQTIKYVASDFLLKSIIKFEIQDIDKYSL